MTKYKINQLSRGLNDVDIDVTIDFTGDVATTGGHGSIRFISAYVKDETGEIKMVFWGQQIKKAKPGAKVSIKNGYVNEYRGELQLNARKEEPPIFGK